MKVVLFCGGLGMRMREYSETIPKPMVPIGYRPILWHLMKYYAHFGHKDFILCLGYRGDSIKEYFLDYKEWLSNDFVLSGGGPTWSCCRATSTTGASPSSTPGSRQHRRAARGGAAAPRGRGRLPRQLQRRLTDVAARPRHRLLPREPAVRPPRSCRPSPATASTSWPPPTTAS